MPGTRSATTYANEEDLRRRVTATRSVAVPGAGRGTAHPLLALQRQIGNRATVASLSGPVVQRDDVVEEGVDKTFETVELLGGQIANWSGMGSIQNMQYVQGNANDPTAIGGMTGSALGVGASLYGAISGGRQATEGKKTLDTEREAGRGKEATARTGKRDYKSGVATTVQSVGGVLSEGIGGVSQVSQIMSNAGSHAAFASANNLIGGIGGVIALPFATLATLRTGRKAAKQYKRFRKLRENVEDPTTSASKATKALEKQQEALQALMATKQDAMAELTEARQMLRSAQRPKSKKDPNKYLQLVNAREDLVTDLEGMIETARQEVTAAETAKTEAEQKLAEYQDRAARGEETAADIKAYAMRKNKSGVIKKIIGTVSGVLGIGGGIAGTIAAFAGAAATVAVGVTSVATPIGWALCGAAAVAGLAMAGYAFWKWASKRYDRLVKEGGAEKGFKTWIKAINPFYKKIPNSHREHMASRLYDVAAHHPATQETLDARNVIADLGLEWDGLKMQDHREASIKLIYAKMAS